MRVTSKILETGKCVVQINFVDLEAVFNSSVCTVRIQTNYWESKSPVYYSRRHRVWSRVVFHYDNIYLLRFERDFAYEGWTCSFPSHQMLDAADGPSFRKDQCVQTVNNNKECVSRFYFAICLKIYNAGKISFLNSPANFSTLDLSDSPRERSWPALTSTNEKYSK